MFFLFSCCFLYFTVPVEYSVYLHAISNLWCFAGELGQECDRAPAVRQKEQAKPSYPEQTAGRNEETRHTKGETHSRENIFHVGSTLISNLLERIFVLILTKPRILFWHNTKYPSSRRSYFLTFCLIFKISSSHPAFYFCVSFSRRKPGRSPRWPSWSLPSRGASRSALSTSKSVWITDEPRHWNPVAVSHTHTHHWDLKAIVSREPGRLLCFLCPSLISFAGRCNDRTRRTNRK